MTDQALCAWCKTYPASLPKYRGCCSDTCCDLMDLTAEVEAMRAELESQERAHAEEVARYQTRLSEAHRAHADALDKLAWLGHVHSDSSRCKACAAYGARKYAHERAQDAELSDS